MPFHLQRHTKSPDFHRRITLQPFVVVETFAKPIVLGLVVEINQRDTVVSKAEKSGNVFMLCVLFWFQNISHSQLFLTIGGTLIDDEVIEIVIATIERLDGLALIKL